MRHYDGIIVSIHDIVWGGMVRWFDVWMGVAKTLSTKLF